MAFTLADYIKFVRNAHPAFEQRILPDKVLADFATLDQRSVISVALQKDRQYLSQSFPVAFDIEHWSQNAPGIAGAGTSGGVPAKATNNGFEAIQTTVGSAVELNTDDVITRVNDAVVASATPTTVTAIGVSWGNNAFIGDTVRIIAGKGYNQPPREIASNSSDTLTVSQPWAIVPDSTSVFEVVQATMNVDGTFGVITDIPSSTTHFGYLVKLNAQGIPYIDVTTPLVTSLSQGIPLPAHYSIYSTTVWGRAASGERSIAYPFELMTYSNRYSPRNRYSGYILGNCLYLNGDRGSWNNIKNLEIHYSPVAPALTARTDFFLLPDNALSWLVSRAVLYAANRLQGNPLIPVFDMTHFVAKEAEEKRQFLGTLGLTKTARSFRIKPGRY